MVPDKFPEAFNRFEREMNIEQAKDTDDLVRKFVAWQNRSISVKQQKALRQIAEERGLIIKPRIKPKGISEIRGIPREKLKVRFTIVTRKTKKGIKITKQARDSKTGRYVKRL